MITCSLSQNFFKKYLPINRSCVFSVFLNDDIADIRNHDGICLPIFVANKFSLLLLHPSIFSIRH